MFAPGSPPSGCGGRHDNTARTLSFALHRLCARGHRAGGILGALEQHPLIRSVNAWKRRLSTRFDFHPSPKIFSSEEAGEVSQNSRLLTGLPLSDTVRASPVMSQSSRLTYRFPSIKISVLTYAIDTGYLEAAEAVTKPGNARTLLPARIRIKTALRLS